jgi:hypothetical protein
MLSVAAQFNDKIAVNVLDWFNNIEIISGLEELDFQESSINKIKDKKGKIQLLAYLKKADLGIIDLELLEVSSGESKEKPYSAVFTLRNKFNNKIKEGTSSFSLNLDESEGTKKYFYLLGPVLDVIENGSVLVIDELDSKLHPNLVEKIVSLFNSKELNPKNAQLIFNTHDTNLLGSELFRRDQIWFTEKNKFGEAKLYSLADFKDVRKGEAFEENYIRGKYGAVPFLGFFDNLLYKEK